MDEQVLLATGGGNLVYIEIGQGTLVEVAHVQLEYEISCLDINPVGDNPERSNLVAVGMWTDISVRIFSLPSLTLITKEMLGGEIIPRSVLFCSFDGVSFSMLSFFLSKLYLDFVSLASQVGYGMILKLYPVVNLCGRTLPTRLEQLI